MIDLDRSDGRIELRTQVCVVGAGAAGITLTRRLLAAGHDVVLLESGGLDYEARIADLAVGENVGAEYYDLEDSRLRFFGGTTAIWGGRCAELDPIDLQKRDYIPHSGWPIGWDELSRYYDEARPLFDLPQRRPELDRLRAAGVPLPAFDPRQLAVPLWTFDKRFNRFTFENCRDIDAHPGCRIVTHATVTAIRTVDGGRDIEAVEARALGGAMVEVRAQAFVLAAGGIENARLLLGNDLGNGHDQVGRYFMEHPHARGGRIVRGASWSLMKAFGRRHCVDGVDLAALIAPSEELQRREGILNTSLTIVGRQPEQARKFIGMKAYDGIKHSIAPTRTGRALWMTTKKAAAWTQQRIDPARPWLLHKLGLVDVALLVRAEQAPNPDSRVTLADDTDPLGMRRVKLDWRLSELDVRSVRVLVDVLGGELERLGLGRVQPADWLSEGAGAWRSDELISSHPLGGFHHMGTTRMSDSPTTGVTDRDARVHGIGNLYVAGSSLFPTGGWANPTLTIVALALRTADTISAQLGTAR